MDFNSLGDLSRHLNIAVASLENLQDLFESKRMADLGEKILETVKDRHGDDSKLRPLEQSTQDERVNLGYPANEPLLRDGDLRDSYDVRIGDDPSGDGKAIIIGSPEEVALYQEIGFYNVIAGVKVDPRPVLLPSVMENAQEIKEAFGDSVAGLFSQSQTGGNRFEGGAKI